MRRRVFLTAAFLMLFAGALVADVGQHNLRGQVVDASGDAVAGAIVELRPWLGSFDDGMQRLRYPAGAGKPLATARSDARGYFELTTPTGGPTGGGQAEQRPAAGFRLEVTVAGHLPMEIRLAHLTDDVELPALELVPAKKLEVRVVDGAGKPLTGARVDLMAGYRHHRGVWRPAAYPGLAGDDGTLTVSDAAAESRIDLVKAFAPGLVPARARPPLPGVVTLALAAGVARTVEVRGAGGKPVADALIRVGKDGWPAGVSGGDGRVVVYPPADGDFRVTVETAAGGWGTRQIAAPEAGETDPVIVELEPPATVSGRVSDAHTDRPVAGAEVSLSAFDSRRRPQYFSDRRQLRHRATTDPEGRFEVRGLEPGQLDLRVTASGYADTRVRGMEIARGDDGAVDLGTVVLELGVRLEGRVVDPDGGPLAEANVHWLPAKANQIRSFSGFRPKVTADAAGRFAIDDLARDEKLNLEASLGGYSQAQAIGVEVPASEPVVMMLEPRGRILGVVVDDRGAPVPRAQVSTMYDSAGSGSYGSGNLCDDEGRFELEIDATDRLRLSAASDELRSTDLWLEIAPGQVVDDLRLVLEPGAVVEGQVLGPAGEPIAGAGVMAYGDRLFHRSYDALSGDDGGFRLAGLETGLLSLQVAAEGFSDADKQLEVRPGTNTVEIRMQDSHQVSGRVVDEVRAPVGGARVSLSGLDGRRGHGEAVSDAGGAFVVAVPDGRYQLRAGKQGFFAWAKLEQEIEVAGAPVDGIEIQLAPGGAIAGRVLGLDVERLAGVTVSTRPGYASSRVDREGRYRLEHLTPGEWTVVAALEGGRRVRGQTVLDPGVSEAILDLEFAAGLTLTGRVVIDGEPAPAATLEVHGLGMAASGIGRRSLQRVATADYRGRFQIADLEPGGYLLVVMQDEAVERLELDLATDREIEIELRTQVVSGRVISEATAEPLQGAVVTLEPGDGNISPASGPPRLQTDGGGHFRFARTAEASYLLRVELPGYATLTRPITVAAGFDLEDLDLRLVPTEGLILKVRLATGGVPRRIGVAAWDANGQLLLNREFAGTEDGTVRLASLPPGSWLLLVAARGTGNVQLAADAPGEPVPVLLPPGTRLDVRIPDLAGSTEPATLSVTGPDGRSFIAMYSHSPLPAGEWPVVDGQAQVQGLPPGHWNLAVTTAGGRSWNATTVAPAQGGSLRVDVE